MQQRKSIFGDNSKKIENEKLNVNFSVDFWILNLYAILQLVIDLTVTKGLNENFKWLQGAFILSLTFIYAVFKVIYTSIKIK